MRVINNGAAQRYHNLAWIEADVSILFNIFREKPFSLPIDTGMALCHPYGSQAIFPVEERPFTVVIAEDQEDIPRHPQAFLTPQGHSVNCRANVWHHLLPVPDHILDCVMNEQGSQENNPGKIFP